MVTEPRPVGKPLTALPSGVSPDGSPLVGKSVSVVRLSPTEHARDLWESFCDADPEGDLWTYLVSGPFPDFREFARFVEEAEAIRDPLFYSLIPSDTRKAAGMAAFMRIRGLQGSVEIGGIWMAPSLQRTRASTEAIFLMMRHAMDDLAYRRLEWKCNALNAASRSAARRYGFTYEGTFRQDLVVKGRNRDTAWFSILDSEWPAIRDAVEAWLSDENFDESGRQRSRLVVPGRATEPPGNA